MSTFSSPLVSVVVTCYEHERFVEQALDSLAAQTYENLEIVVVDDASTDSSADRIQAWIEREGAAAQLVVNERNLGLCATRNVALARCRGEFVCSLSADDWYTADKVRRQVEHFATLGPEVSSVLGQIALVDESGVPMGPVWPGRIPTELQVDGEIFGRLVRSNFIPAPTVMTRRAALEVVGPYDESLSYDDYDMWLRLASRYRFSFLPGVVVNHRVLARSLSRDPAWRLRHLESTATLLAKWLGRDPAIDDAIFDRTWYIGRHAYLLDARRGRAILADRRCTRGRFRRRAFLWCAAIPGSGRAAKMALAVKTAVERRRRAGAERS